MGKVAGATDRERAKACAGVKKVFESPRGRIPGMTQLEVGADFSAIDCACDLILVAGFESRKALDGHATQPEHAHVRDELTRPRGNRRAAQPPVLNAGNCCPSRAPISAPSA
ncbi:MULTISPECIES: Dabb family protein [unclassified Burkholderia]|uniref:Dabb family protein n=1 Tax=unclassified Burkholderia TaxID=2613784 RepID=UPI00128C0C10|nr:MULTISPECIES: Dabb family protein [unclassified Burkholderia]